MAAQRNSWHKGVNAKRGARPPVQGPAMRPFDVSVQRPGSQSAFFGERINLFQVAANVDVSELQKYSLTVERNLAARLYALARRARDMARAAAPVKSGALRAGIYATGPASKPELQALRADSSLKAATGKMRGHSSGYYRALSAAARRKGVDALPGSKQDVADTGERYVSERTQRPLKGVDREELSYAMGLGGEDEELPGDFYKGLATKQPFNSMGQAGRSAFFVGIGSAMFYSAWVEFGTARARAHPFFTPAAKWMSSNAGREVAASFKRNSRS